MLIAGVGSRCAVWSAATARALHRRAVAARAASFSALASESPVFAELIAALNVADSKFLQSPVASLLSYDRALALVEPHSAHLALVVHQRRVARAALAFVDLPPSMTRALLDTWRTAASGDFEACARFLLEHWRSLSIDAAGVRALLEFANASSAPVSAALAVVHQLWSRSRLRASFNGDEVLAVVTEFMDSQSPELPAVEQWLHALRLTITPPNTIKHVRLLARTQPTAEDTSSGSRVGVAAALESLRSLDASTVDSSGLAALFAELATAVVAQNRLDQVPVLLDAMQRHSAAMNAAMGAVLVSACINAGRSDEARALYHSALATAESHQLQVLLEAALPVVTSTGDELELTDWISRAHAAQLSPSLWMLRALVRAISRSDTGTRAQLLVHAFQLARSPTSINSALLEEFLTTAASTSNFDCVKFFLDARASLGLPMSDRSVLTALTPFSDEALVSLLSSLPLDFLLAADAMIEVISQLDSSEAVERFIALTSERIIEQNRDVAIRMQLTSTIVVSLMANAHADTAIELTRNAVKFARSSQMPDELLTARIHSMMLSCHRRCAIDEAGVLRLLSLYRELRTLAFPVTLSDCSLLLHEAANIARSPNAIGAVMEFARDSTKGKPTGAEWHNAANAATRLLAE